MMTEALKDQIVEAHGRRWKVREALSMGHALGAILDAAVSGSVGARRILDERFVGGGQTVQADVVEINSDGSERKPYTTRY